MYPFLCMVEEDRRERLWQDYTASMTGLILQTMVKRGGGTWDAPSFIDLAYPEEQDNRSAEEIKNHVAALFA